MVKPQTGEDKDEIHSTKLLQWYVCVK